MMDGILTSGASAINYFFQIKKRHGSDKETGTTQPQQSLSCDGVRQVTLGSVFVTSFSSLKHGPIQPIAKASGEKIAERLRVSLMTTGQAGTGKDTFSEKCDQPQKMSFQVISAVQ